MKKVLFVDEKFYRFNLYYKSSDWWSSKNIKSIFKAYETKKDKWLIYLWLIFNRPEYIVCVQLSLKNIFLIKLCNILKIKTLFWQHGVFGYDKLIISKYRKINAHLDVLLAFSEYDANGIGSYFKSVSEHKIIPHYEIESISSSKIEKNAYLFIGQILTKSQLKQSNSRINYDEKSESLTEDLWQFLDDNNYKVFYKKHPGDRSDYLENLKTKHDNIKEIEHIILPKAIIGHYSTLVLPYLALGIPFIQLRHDNNSLVNFEYYTNNDILKIDTNLDIKVTFDKLDELETETQCLENYCLSDELVNIINERNE